MSKPTVMLVDGYSLIFRGFHALPLLTTAKGDYTNLKYAIELADALDAENCAMKDKFIAENGTACNPSAYEKLDDIKVEILRTWFKEQLEDK